MSQQRERRRIGLWRLLDIMQATAPWRASMMGGATWNESVPGGCCGAHRQTDAQGARQVAVGDSPLRPAVDTIED